MAIIPTPEDGKQITDYTAGTFDSNSLIYQSRNGQGYKIDGDDIANYVVVNKVYPSLGNKSIPESIGKVLSQTLTAGSTTVTFSDASIVADSLINVYAPVWYSGYSFGVNSVTITFPAQASDITVKVRIN